MSQAASASATTLSWKLDFHGVGVELDTTWPGLATMLKARLRSFPAAGESPSDLVFRFMESAYPAKVLPRPTGPSRSIYEAPRGEVTYFPGTDEMFIDDGGDARLLVAPSRRETLVAFRRGTDKLWLLSHPLFTLALIELMKRMELFSVHAAGVALAGHALLLPGPSGAGKSTLTLALIDRGLRFLGDDMLFLKNDQPGIRVLAFPDEVDVTSETLGMFPRLHPQASTPRRPGWTKWQVEDGVPSGRAVEWTADPALVVFPRVAGTKESTLHALSHAEALIELAPNVLLTDPKSSQAHLDALAALVGSAECYRLDTGTDVTEAADVLETLLCQAATR
jgi:hypothetical protein